jgi:hypothetical protein
MPFLVCAPEHDPGSHLSGAFVPYHSRCAGRDPVEVNLDARAQRSDESSGDSESDQLSEHDPRPMAGDRNAPVHKSSSDQAKQQGKGCVTPEGDTCIPVAADMTVA